MGLFRKKGTISHIQADCNKGALVLLYIGRRLSAMGNFPPLNDRGSLPRQIHLNPFPMRHIYCVSFKSRRGWSTNIQSIENYLRLISRSGARWDIHISKLIDRVGDFTRKLEFSRRFAPGNPRPSIGPTKWNHFRYFARVWLNGVAFFFRRLLRMLSNRTEH